MCKKVHLCQPIFFDFELAVGQLGPLSGFLGGFQSSIRPGTGMAHCPNMGSKP